MSGSAPQTSEPQQWCPKMLRERLCAQQTHAPDRFTRGEIQRLIDVLDLHRPLGSDGKHGNRHTPTCGCDDRQPTAAAMVLEQAARHLEDARQETWNARERKINGWSTAAAELSRLWCTTRRAAVSQSTVEAAQAPLWIHVIGEPAPQGSKRHVGGGRLIESSKKVAPWRETVAADAHNAAADQHWRVPDGPVRIDALFRLHRPPSAPRRRRLPDRKPDLDKLLRSTLDALVTAGVLADDARVVNISAGKVYAAAGEPLGVDVTITDLSTVEAS